MVMEILIKKIDVIKYSFSHRTINLWNKSFTDCVHASTVNMFMNRIDTYIVRTGVSYNSICELSLNHRLPCLLPLGCSLDGNLVQSCSCKML